MLKDELKILPIYGWPCCKWLRFVSWKYWAYEFSEMPCINVIEKIALTKASNKNGRNIESQM